ncbi:hypothetical protein BC834DRAFT_896216 [Gloeopeniophorella convolvens]|nr:hypothetical protein BC834DRAFT_896216 [Gloeopeniophorella convolvens]
MTVCDDEIASCPQPVTIHSISDIALLEVFHYYKEARLAHFSYSPPSRPWYRLVPAHVCHRWRQLIVASPKRLDLELRCSWRPPLAGYLHLFPGWPLVLQYLTGECRPNEYRMAEPARIPTIASRDTGNILLALSDPTRLWGVSLEAPPVLLGRFLTVMDKPPPELRILHLETSAIISLPTPFLTDDASKLRNLHLFNVIPPLPRSPHVVDFRFGIHPSEDPPDGGWMNELLGCICAMPLLTSLHLNLYRQTFSLHSVAKRTSLSSLERLVFIRNAPKLKHGAAHVGLTENLIFVDSCPRHGEGKITIEIEHDGADPATSVIRLVMAFESIFEEMEILALGFNQGSHGFPQVESSFEAAPIFWQFLLSPFGAVKKLYVDGIASYPVTMALKGGGFATNQILPQVNEILLFAHGQEEGVNLHECMEFFDDVSQEHRYLDASCRLLTYVTWLDRYNDLNAGRY